MTKYDVEGRPVEILDCLYYVCRSGMREMTLSTNPNPRVYSDH